MRYFNMTLTGRPGRGAPRAPIAGMLGMALVVAALSGCGGGEDDGLDRQAVSGTITMGGKPLEKGTVQFLPDGGDAAKAIGGGAPIADGSYTIPSESGLPPGNYLVSISSPAGGADLGAGPGSAARLPKETIPSQYNTATTLKAQVKSGERNTIDFELKP
jgi:hypothetical protein